MKYKRKDVDGRVEVEEKKIRPRKQPVKTGADEPWEACAVRPGGQFGGDDHVCLAEARGDEEL